MRNNTQGGRWKRRRSDRLTARICSKKRKREVDRNAAEKGSEGKIEL